MQTMSILRNTIFQGSEIQGFQSNSGNQVDFTV